MGWTSQPASADEKPAAHQRQRSERRKGNHNVHAVVAERVGDEPKGERSKRIGNITKGRDRRNGP